MKKFLYLVVVVVAVGVLAYLLTSGSTTEQTKDSTPSIDATDLVFKQAINEVSEQTAVLLDVRTPQEYSEKHAVGSVLFEVTRLDNGELPRYPAETKLYVYCRSGSRSARAVDTLRKAGFTDVTDLGALSDWEAAGGPVQST